MPAAAGDARLRIVIEGEARAAIAAFQRVQGQAGRLGMSAGNLNRSFQAATGGITRQLQGVAVAAAAISVPLVRVGREAFDTFSGFEQSLSRIEGLVGLNRDVIDDWADDIIGLAPQVGQTPQALADALFFATSAGLEGSRAMDAVTASARAATGGLGELAEIVDAATSAMNAYDPSVLSAEQATDILVATVREGKLEAGDLAGVIGDVIPLAAQLGVEFHEVGGLIAGLSRTGSDASKAVTGVRAALRSLAGPGAAAIEQLDLAVGIREALDAPPVAGSGLVEIQRLIRDQGPLRAFQAILEGLFENAGVQGAEALEGMVQRVRELRDAGLDSSIAVEDLTANLGEGGAVLSKALRTIFQDSKGLLTVLDLLGPSFATNVEIAEELRRDAEAGVATQAAFAAAAETASFGIDAARAAWEAFLATIGEALAPTAIEVLRGITQFVSEITARFRDLDPERQQFFIQLLGAIAGVAAVAGIASTLALIANPVGLIAAGVAALGAGVFFLVQNWDDVVAFLREFKDRLVDLVPEGIIRGVENFVNGLRVIGGFVRNLVTGGFSIDQLSDSLADFLPPFVVDNIRSVVDGIGDIAEAVRGFLSGELSLGDALGSVFSGLSQVYLGPIFNTFNALGEGVISILNRIIEQINNVITNQQGNVRGIFRAVGIRSAIPELSFQPLQIPRFQEGGIVTEPTLALIGEAGPEAVVPLSQGEARSLRGRGEIPRFQEGGIVTEPTLAMVGEAGPEAIVPVEQLPAMLEIIAYHGSYTGDPEDWRLRDGVLWTTTNRRLADLFAEGFDDVGGHVRRVDLSFDPGQVLEVVLPDPDAGSRPFHAPLPLEVSDALDDLRFDDEEGGSPPVLETPGYENAERDDQGRRIVFVDVFLDAVRQTGLYDIVHFQGRPGAPEPAVIPTPLDPENLELLAFYRGETYALAQPLRAVAGTAEAMQAAGMDPFREGFDRPMLDPLREGFDLPMVDALREGFDQPMLDSLREGFDRPIVDALREGFDRAPSLGGILADMMARFSPFAMLNRFLDMTVPRFQEGGS